MARFYETTILVDTPNASREPWGIQVLASPPEIEGRRINYEPLLDLVHDDSSLKPIRVRGDDEMRQILGALANPEWNRRFERVGEFTLQAERPTAVDLDVGTYLLRDAQIAAETSPLAPQTIWKLAGGSATITFLVIAGVPTVVIASGTVGVIFLRGLGAVGGALWTGAKPNVEHLGDKASAKLIDAICRRLNLEQTDPKKRKRKGHRR
jgi:hypothetical protein